MKCLKCQFENAAGTKFCAKCGSKLELGELETDTADRLNPAVCRDPSNEPLSKFSSPICPIRQSPCLLDLIAHISTCLTQTMDVDQFLEGITAEMVNSFDSDAAGMLLYDERLKDFYWREVRDHNRVLAGKAFQERLQMDRIAFDTAFQSGEPLVMGDGYGVAVPQSDTEAHAKSPIHNALMVPLNTREKTIGFLVLANKKTGPFKERDIGIISSLAAIVAMSLEHADFFEDLLDSHGKVAGLDRIKSKILHRLSHELKTPLAVMKASLRNVEMSLKERGISDFNAAFARLFRQVENLGRLEQQVNSIMKRGYAEEREMISGLLESATSLIEVQAEQMPEVKRVASMLLRTLEDAFPANRQQWGRISVKEFGQSVLHYVRDEMARQGRSLELTVDFDDGAEILIPDLVLHATIEGLVRNAVEATPDNGMISVRGHSHGDFYVLTVEDSGIGIPEEDWGLVFEGFYQVQDTDDYTSGRPYAFNAGGKGMDLFRIKMFSKIYGFGLYFRSRRCVHLIESLRKCPGSVDLCPYCTSFQDCIGTGGTVFEADLLLTSRHSRNCRSA